MSIVGVSSIWKVKDTEGESVYNGDTAAVVMFLEDRSSYSWVIESDDGVEYLPEDFLDLYYDGELY